MKEFAYGPSLARTSTVVLSLFIASAAIAQTAERKPPPRSCTAFCRDATDGAARYSGECVSRCVTGRKSADPRRRRAWQ